GRTTRAARLHVDGQPVVGALRRRLGPPRQHLRAQVGQDHAPRADPAQPGGERGVVQVVSDLPPERVGLADEQVGAPRGGRERLAPSGVARVGERAAGPLEAERVGERAARVLDRERLHGCRAEPGGGVRGDFDQLEREAADDPRGAGEEDLHRLRDPGARAGRARDRQRRLAAAELAVQDQERDPAEVVAVEVAQAHPADRRRVEAGALEGDQGGGAAVEQEAPAGAVHAEARLQPAARPERVARAEEPDAERAGHAVIVAGRAEPAGGGAPAARASPPAPGCRRRRAVPAPADGLGPRSGEREGQARDARAPQRMVAETGAALLGSATSPGRGRGRRARWRTRGSTSRGRWRWSPGGTGGSGSAWPTRSPPPARASRSGAGGRRRTRPRRPGSSGTAGRCWRSPATSRTRRRSSARSPRRWRGWGASTRASRTRGWPGAGPCARSWSCRPRSGGASWR